MSDTDPLARRALAARTSLQEATLAREVPSLDLPGRARVPARVRWAVPVLAAAAVLAVVAAGLWGGSQAPHRLVVPGAVSSVGAGQLPVAVATDGRQVWVADAGSDEIIAFDAHSLRRHWAVPVASRPVALATGLGALWVVIADGNQLLKLDPETGRVLGSARTSLDPVAVDIAFGAVWVLSAGNETLDRYAPTTVTQTGSAVVGAAGRGVSHSADALWVSVPSGLMEIDPHGEGLPVQPISLAGHPRAVASSSDGSLWVKLASGKVVTVDSSTGATLGRVALSAPATALAPLGDGVVLATADGQLHRFDGPDVPGQVIASTGVRVDSLATAKTLIFGAARRTALVYATEVSE
jgi:virginiamycin B lyase